MIEPNPEQTLESIGRVEKIEKPLDQEPQLEVRIPLHNVKEAEKIIRDYLKNDYDPRDFHGQVLPKMIYFEILNSPLTDEKKNEAKHHYSLYIKNKCAKNLYESLIKKLRALRNIGKIDQYHYA